jgi:antitoxin CcdA
MEHAPILRTRRPINVSLDTAAVAEAKDLGINISKACEAGLVADISEKRREKWLLENQHKFKGWNDWVEENGLPLAKFRPF